jgi:hypothetical protein
MPAIYVVQFESHDGYEPDGPRSVWSNWGDAEAARGEAYAMDPEGHYFVEEIVDQPQISFYDYSNCTEVPF